MLMFFYPPHHDHCKSIGGPLPLSLGRNSQSAFQGFEKGFAKKKSINLDMNPCSLIPSVNSLLIKLHVTFTCPLSFSGKTELNQH